MNAFEICDTCCPFPKVKDALLRRPSASDCDVEEVVGGVSSKI